MKKLSTQQLCNDAMLIAIYFVLAKLTIPIGNLHITLASLPIVVLAVLQGPGHACLVAFLGEFVIQALGRYGLTLLTPLWCLPPTLRALVVGLGCRWLCKGREREHMVSFFAVTIVAAMLTTVANTLVIWFEATIYGYYTWVYVFGQFLVRLLTGVVTAVVVSILALPVVRVLRRVHLTRRRR